MSLRCPAGHLSQALDYCDVCGVPVSTASGPGTPDVVAAAPDAPAGDVVPSQLLACPSCGTADLPDALFCESCGYDFTTGSMPRPLDPPVAAADPDAATGSPSTGSASTGSASTGSASTGSASTGSAGTDPPPAATGGTAASGGTAAPVSGFVAEVWIDPAWYAVQQSPDPLPSAGLPEVVALRSRSLLVGRVSQSRAIHPDVDCRSDSGVSRRQAQLTTDGTRWWVEDLDSANGTFVGPATGALPLDPIPVGVTHELDPDDRVYVGAWTRLVIRPATPEEQPL